MADHITIEDIKAFFDMKPKYQPVYVITEKEYEAAVKYFGKEAVDKMGFITSKKLLTKS